MKVLLNIVGFFAFCIIYSGAFFQPGEAWCGPKGKIVVAQGGEATTLDPHMQQDIMTQSNLRQVYEHLVDRVFKGNNIQFLPMLATSWEAINNTTWIFHLRKGVKFHNGEDFTAEAVKYSIDRTLDPAQKAASRWAFTFIDRVEIVDSHTVRIITKAPSPVLVANLSKYMYIVPPKYFKEKGDNYVSTNPVGTGPFKFVHWKKDQEIMFEANENYWAGPPNIKTLIFKPIPEDSTRVAALLGGDVDIIKKIPTHLIPMVNKSGRARVMEVESGLGIGVILDTLKQGPLQDKRVRQALNYGVDKEGIIKYVLEGYGKPLGGPLAPAQFGYDPNVKPYPYDPEKAKALLKEAGYGDGLTLTLNSPSGRYPKDKEFAEAIAGQLGKIGINVKVEVWEWGNYMAKYYSPEWVGPMCIMGYLSTFDADAILYQLLRCGGYHRFCNKEFDSLLEQARTTLDQNERKKIYSKALRLCHEEAPWIFLFNGIDTYGVSNRVQNWKSSPDEVVSFSIQALAVKD